MSELHTVHSFQGRENAQGSGTAESGPRGVMTVYEEAIVDPDSPMNWPKNKKWKITLTISMLSFLTPFASSIIAPSINQIMQEMKTTNPLLGSFAVSIFILGYAFGPLIIGPCSEVFGRLVVYHVCNFLFIIWSIACALSTNMSMLIVFRFFAGTAGSCAFTVGPSSIGDVFKSEERGKGMAIMSLPALLGPCLGPAVGAYFSKAAGWRWTLWLIVIMAVVAFIISLVTLRETHPLICRRRNLARRAASEEVPAEAVPDMPQQTFFTGISRPIKLLALSPLIVTLSLLSATTYGILYLMFTTLSEVFETRYGIHANVGLVFFGIGLGQIVGTSSFGVVSDALVSKMAGGGKLKPEYRLPPMIPGAVLIPVGLLVYGWTAQYRVHWFAPIFGTFLTGIGINIVFIAVITYIVDAYPLHAASATAATTVLRSMGGALLPLAGPKMYSKLDQGWGNTLLAGLSFFGMGAIWFTMKYGESLRTNPRFQIKL